MNSDRKATSDGMTRSFLCERVRMEFRQHARRRLGKTSKNETETVCALGARGLLGKTDVGAAVLAS